MKEKTVEVDESQENKVEILINLENAKKSMQALSYSFVDAGQKIKELADFLRGEPVDVYDPLTDKRKKQQSFKNGVSNLKHIKKRGGK